MDEIIAKIKEFFDKDSWNYSFDDKLSIFRFGINMDSVLGSLDYYIIVRDNSYTVYTTLNSKAETETIDLIAEFLHRANYGLRIGNFEIDFDDGEIRYKVYVETSISNLTDEVIGRSIFIPASMFEKYGKGLLEIMISKGNPKSIIEKIENEEKHN